MKTLATAIITAVAAASSQQWAYVDVRPGAHMFYWMYSSTETPSDQAPLIWWLQGGPGAASTGYGDFEEMGPLNIYQAPRNTTWVKSANVVYIDNPVGTGYSYVDNLSLLTTNLTQIADDLVTFAIAFFDQHPALRSNKWYVFSESYGGKMATGFAAAALKAMDEGRLNATLSGIALGDSWISPISYVDTWGPWLRMLSVMDANQFNTQIQPAVQQCDAAVAAGQWEDATNYWGNVENVVDATTDGISFYNVLIHNDPDGLSSSSLSASSSSSASARFPSAAAAEKARLVAASKGLSQAALSVKPAGVAPSALRTLYARHVGALRYSMGSGLGLGLGLGMGLAVGDDPDADLNVLMNGPVKQQLGIIPANVTWGGQSDAVFSAQSGDFMVPVVDIVDSLLKDGRINVTVYQGQLDLICATVGTEAWMEGLTWQGYQAFVKSPKTPLYSWPGTTETGGFVKTHGPLSYYTIMNAGHMLPADNGDMAYRMMRLITGQDPMPNQ